MNNEKIWLHDLPVLWRKYSEFFPANNMNKIQKYNAISRYLIYIIILFAVFQYNQYFLVLSVLMLIGIVYIGFTLDDNPSSDEATKKCRNSTADNPAANPLIMEDDPNLEACSINKKTMNSNILKNLYEDSNDVNKRRILERAFYTLPVSNYPNNIHFIGGYLYNDEGNHCKEKKEGCEYYRDLRFKR